MKAAAKKIRSPRHRYRLMVDPDRLRLRDTIDGWILEILIKRGGLVSREDLVKEFTKVLRRRRPHVTVRPTTILSAHQRELRDKGILQIIDKNGRPIPTRERSSLTRG